MAERALIYWGDQLPKKAPDTETLIFTSEQVERGQVFRVSICNIVNESKSNTLLELGIKTGNAYHPIVKCKAGANNYSLQPNVRGLVLDEGEQLYGKVYNPDAGDLCVLVYSGELYLRGEKAA